MTRKLVSRIGMFPSIIGMLAVLSLLGACNGLIDDTEDDQIAQAMNQYGAVVQIPIASVGNRALVDIGLDSTAKDKYVTYYEAIFKKTGSPNEYYVGKAEAGKEFIVVGVPPNTGYEVLVLAGASASNNSTSGEKVLLASGITRPVNITAGKVNKVKVTMYNLEVSLEVVGMKKGALSNASPGTVTIGTTGTTPGFSIVTTVPNDTLRYVQLEKAAAAVAGTNGYRDLANPWYQTGSFKDLTVNITLGNLAPLLFASPGYSDDGTGPFTSDKVQISPLNYGVYAYTMDIISFPDIPTNRTLAAYTAVTTAVAENGTGLTHTDLEFSYKVAAGTSTTKSTIPDYDAAGNFFFNMDYYPFCSEDSLAADIAAVSAAGASKWNVRNRILWEPNGYYGGGVVFLFGNAAPTAVIVDPIWP